MAHIYVGTWAKHNAGSLDGQWLDLEDYSSIDEFHAACAELHKGEEDPEFMYQDWKDCFGMVSESSIDPALWDVLDYVAQNKVAPEAIQAFLDEGYDWDRDAFEDAYCGYYGHEPNPQVAYAEELINDCYDLEKMMGQLASYFDYEAFACDLFITDHWETGGHVFRAI